MEVQANPTTVEIKKRPGSGFRMILAAIVANLPGLSSGLAMGFSAILIPQLQSSSSDIPIDLEQGSWIASAFVIGDLVGCLVGGPIADRFGRRLAILMHCVPLSVGWILCWQSQSLAQLYAARIITGVGIGAGVPIASMYLREISTPEMRGTLAIFMPTAANIGNLLMYILGYFLQWRCTTLPGIIIPLLPVVFLNLLPESPTWLIQRGRKEEAQRNLALLRGQSLEYAEAELNQMHQQQVPETADGKPKQNLHLLLDRSVVFPMCLLVFLFSCQSFSGSNMVSYYTVTIFQIAEIPLDENIAAMMVAAQYVLGYSMSSYFVLRFPRRVLLFASLSIMIFANTAAGIVLERKSQQSDEHFNVTHHLSIMEADQLIPPDIMILSQSEAVHHSSQSEAVKLSSDQSEVEHMLSIVPVISCILISFGYGIGIGPVPFILMAELFPSSVRGTATSLTAFLRSTTVFLSIKIFPFFLDTFGIGGSFFASAAVCSTALVFSYFAIPETKGLDTVQLESIYTRIKTEEAEHCERKSLGSKESEWTNLV